MLCGHVIKLVATALLTVCVGGAGAAVVSVQGEGKGCDYMSGDPINLPAAALSTNRFGIGARCILNRSHCVKPAVFNRAGQLELRQEPDVVPTPPPNVTNGFPAYLEGQQYIRFLQDVRHYTNYACTVSVDCPSTFYLLVDNRVNDFSNDKAYSDPVFGPPDTEWVQKDGWERVNTGLTPAITSTNRGDYVGIDEGCNGTVNQCYAVYRKTLTRPGAITLRTQFEGNFYCLVVSTNLPADEQTTQKPGQLSRKPPGQKAEATGLLRTGQISTGSD